MRALGDACDGKHVVEAHDDIGERDRPHRLGESGGSSLFLLLARLLVMAALLGHELDGDVDQQEGANYLQERPFQERAKDQQENEAQEDRHARAKRYAPCALFGRQAAAGERDDDRIVAGKDDVHPEDLGEQPGEMCVEQIEHASAQIQPIRDEPAFVARTRTGMPAVMFTGFKRLSSLPVRRSGHRETPPEDRQLHCARRGSRT